jgi:hypothetical protein
MRARSVIVASVLALLVSASPARGAAITIESTIVQPNELFFLNVGIVDVDDLLSFAFDVLFDPGVISLVGVQEGEFLARGGTTIPCTVSDGNEAIPCATGPGTVSIGNFLLAAQGVSDDGLGGVLATLQFLAGSGGSTQVTLSTVSLANSSFEEIAFDAPIPGDVVVGDIAPIPEPSTLALVGLGLAGLARNRFRKRAA